MKNLNLLLVISLNFLSILLIAQNRESDPGWQWARLTNTVNALGSEEILTDADNNTISLFYYGDSVLIEDTAFNHDVNYASYNIAIVKRNSEGDFIKAADIYTNPGEFLFNTDLETDHESSIYLFGTFSDTLFINDTMIIRPEPGIDIYLLKFDKNLEFQWGRTISSAYQDDSECIAVSEDDFIYLSARHWNSMDTSHHMVNYFDQDSADVSSGLNSFLKVDKDGLIIWRAEIRDDYDGFAEIINTIAGSDGNIYLVGHATNDLYIQGDTVEFPSSPEFYMPGFIVQFEPDGVHHDAFFIPYPQFGFYIPETNIDADGNYIISEEISETMIFGSDTIELSNDSTYTMIAKFDPSFQPIWQRGIKTAGSASTFFQIDLIEDDIAFVFQGKSRFTFMGQEYVLNAIGQIFSGLFSAEGDLVELQVTDASIGAKLHSFKADNCGNLMIDGLIRGLAHFGNDTLYTGYADLPFLAKNSRNPPVEFSLGNDTTILLTGTLELNSVPGYDSYLWSTGDTTSSLIIPASQLQIGINSIWLEIIDGHCLYADTINITVIDNSSVDESAAPYIQLIPNPAMYYVQVISKPDVIPERIVFYNLQGINVLDIRPGGNIIDISFIETGIYIIELFFKDELVRKKLVIY